jgi:hypothetical protein
VTAVLNRAITFARNRPLGRCARRSFKALLEKGLFQ